MKKIWKTALQIGFLCVVIVFSLRALTKLTERKAGEIFYRDFFNETQDIDVLFLGSSHMYNAVFPMELWSDYGITSYNLGVMGNKIPASYWMLQNSLNQCTPKTVVIDCYFLNANAKLGKNDYNIHMMIDPLPMGLTKIQTVFDLTDDWQQRAELLWNYIIYHDRWKSLDISDFAPYSSCTNGACARPEVALNYEEIPEVDASFVSETNGVIYLKKMIELCRDKGIEVVLLYLPFPAGEKEQREANKTSEIAEEYGVEYINYLKLKDLVDFRIDCSDIVNGTGHLNAAGGLIITDHLGRYLKEHFELEDQRENPAYAHWAERYQNYVNGKINAVRTIDNLHSCLMLMNDDDFSYSIYIPEGQHLEEDPTTLLLLKRLGITDEILHAGETTMTTVNRKTGETTMLTDRTGFDSAFGYLSLEGHWMCIDHEPILETLEESKIGIMLYDNRTDQQVFVKQF